MESVTHFDFLNMEPLLERNIGVVPVRDVNLRSQKRRETLTWCYYNRGEYNWIEQTQRAQGRGFFAAFVSELPGSIKKSQGPKSLGLPSSGRSGDF
jgi:hypothetical protein